MSKSAVPADPADPADYDVHGPFSRPVEYDVCGEFAEIVKDVLSQSVPADNELVQVTPVYTTPAATPVYTTPAAPVYTTQAAPIYTKPAATPVYTTQAAPIYTKPANNVEKIMQKLIKKFCNSTNEINDCEKCGTLYRGRICYVCELMARKY